MMKQRTREQKNPTLKGIESADIEENAGEPPAVETTEQWHV